MAEERFPRRGRFPWGKAWKRGSVVAMGGRGASDWKRFWKQFVGLFFGLILGSLVLPYILAGEIYEYQDSVDGVHLPPVDAIVCLAGGRGRISAAGDLWYRYMEMSGEQESGVSLPVLYVSGMGPKANWGVFRRQLRSGVRDVIRPEHVVIENESYNTETNAQWFRKFVAGRNWKRVILITSSYHMRRSQLIFHRVLQGIPTERGGVQVETLSAFQDPFEPGEWRTSVHGTHVTLVEYLKWIYYRFFWNPEPMV